MKESKELLEGVLEKKLEEEGKPLKEKRKTQAEVVENFETFLDEHFEKARGFVQKEAKIKDIEQLTNYINTIID